MDRICTKGFESAGTDRFPRGVFVSRGPRWLAGTRAARGVGADQTGATGPAASSGTTGDDVRSDPGTSQARDTYGLARGLIGA